MRAVAALCILLVPATAPAQTWTVTSPNGATAVALTRSGEGRLTWAVSRRGGPLLEPSPLGIRRDDTAFVDGLSVVAAGTPRRIDERYSTPIGKRREHHVVASEQVVAFANADGARVEIVLRAHDDGAAVRYHFPGTGRHTVIEELTGFAVPAGTTGWLMPYQAPGRYNPAYEDYFEPVAAATAAPHAAGWAFPALFRTGAGKWLLITESGLDGEYCGSHLAASAAGGVYRIQFPDAGEGRGVGERLPSSTLPWSTPWRVVIAGDRAGDILESDLVNDLAPASRITDPSWIRPGRAAWSWWSASNSPRHAKELNAFTDLAAEMGWEYALVDANWNAMETGRIEDVLAHARQKKVELLFWYNSGGPHNDVTEAPRDRMHTREARRAEFARLREWGVKGVKVDFWQSDKQDRLRQYREVLEDAAEFQILVNFHGSTMPRGWQREFPHLVSMEGVAGAEQYKFREDFPTRAAAHNTTLPFTRNVVGSMDYTPVTFSDAKFPHRTTYAHELAQSVVFESGVQHYADSVEAYRGLPDDPKQFLKAMPAAWDETRALAGEPARMVVVARRDGRTWYVGGLNGRDASEDVRVSFDFLGPGRWTALLIRDGDADRTFASERRSVTAQDAIALTMRPRGGFVVQLMPASGGAW